MRLCSVHKCYSVGAKGHRFPNPLKDLTRFREWLRRIRNPSLQTLDPIKVYKSHRVCGLSLQIPSENVNMTTDLTIQSSEQVDVISRDNMVPIKISNVNINFEKTTSPQKRKIPATSVYNSSKFKQTDCRNKIRAASCRQRLKMFAKFEMKLKSKVLRNDVIHFCLSQLRKRNVKPRRRRYTTEEKIFALGLHKYTGRGFCNILIYEHKLHN